MADGGRNCGGLRFLDALGLDVPTSEIVLQYTDKTLFRVVTLLSTADRTHQLRQSTSRGAPRRKTDSPKNKIRMRHEICYALEHAPGFEDEGREGNFVEVHAHSEGLVVRRRSRTSVHEGGPP